mgnify:CR=1 FL=1
MNTGAGIVGGLVVGAIIGYGAASLKGGGKFEDITLFELDGTKYKEADLPADIRSNLYDIRAEAFDRQNALINQFALQFGLAKDKDKNVKADSIPAFDVLVETPAPTDQEIMQVYEANKARLPENTPMDQVKPEIERYLKTQKLTDAVRAKNQEFVAKKRFVLLAPEPTSPKVNLVLDGYGARGPAGSPNVVVEVADYLCPNCQAVAPEVESTYKELGDKFRFFAVPFSLQPAGLSGTLARGAFCARQQGDDAFWKYHEKTFATAKEKGWKLSDPDSKDFVVALAAEAGIDQAKMDACVNSPEAANFVKNTNDNMRKSGVTGTPSFFMNNRRMSLANKSFKDVVKATVQPTSH